jgi:hypothetical protein
MEATTQKTIEKVKAQIDALEEELVKKKEMVNSLCEMESEPPMFPNVARNSSTGAITFRTDQFYGRPVATSVKEILEQRHVRNLGAISLDELFTTMKEGGFIFENKDEKIAKRNLAITLSMNPAFRRIPPSGHIGLNEWYSNIPKKKDKEVKRKRKRKSRSKTPASSEANL